MPEPVEHILAVHAELRPDVIRRRRELADDRCGLWIKELWWHHTCAAWIMMELIEIRSNAGCEQRLYKREADRCFESRAPNAVAAVGEKLLHRVSVDRMIVPVVGVPCVRYPVGLIDQL